MTIIISVWGSIYPYFPRLGEKNWGNQNRMVQFNLVNGSINFSLFSKTIKTGLSHIELSFHGSKIYITKYTTLAIF